MTLLDAPKYDEARARRHRFIAYGSGAAILVLIIGGWLLSGRPVDWPWFWFDHLESRMTVNSFLSAVERNDLPTAYGIWIHDKNWQQHPTRSGVYPFSRFEQDWSSTSPDNEYGSIQSHKIAAERRYGNGMLVASLINGRKSKALNLAYEPKTHQLSFSPPGVELYLGP